MMRKVAESLADTAMLLRLSLRLQLGRRPWLVPALALLWPLYHAVTVLAGWRELPFDPAKVQNGLIGIPLTVLAIGLGIRVVAAEIEQRTLEVAYTVPGGARRVWIGKLGAVAVPMLGTGVLLASVAAVFSPHYPLSAVYGALQGAALYLVLAAGLGALLRNEITAALVASVVLGLNGFLTGFGNVPSRWSPLFNPLVVVKNASETQMLAWTVQNRIGFALLIVAFVMLTCARAERREKLLNMS
jgi:ABC-type transport system involved in multi-copper enzyme maturation permease subunit